MSSKKVFSKNVEGSQAIFKGIAGDSNLIFRFQDGNKFYLKSFKKGIMTIEPAHNCRFYEFAHDVIGCFEEDSNFYGVKAIEFDFNGVWYTVTAESVQTEEVVHLSNKNKGNL